MGHITDGDPSPVFAIAGNGVKRGDLFVIDWRSPNASSSWLGQNPRHLIPLPAALTMTGDDSDALSIQWLSTLIRVMDKRPEYFFGDGGSSRL